VQITRRQFLRYVAASAAAMGLSETALQKAIEVMAKDTSAYKVVWLSGQACTGCTMAFSDLMSWGKKAKTTASDTLPIALPITCSSTATPDYFDIGAIDDVLASLGAYQAGDTVDDVLLDVIDLDYHETLSAAAGDLAMDLVRFWSPRVDNLLTTYTPPIPDRTVLVVEGAIPVTGNDAWGKSVVGEKACTIGSAPLTIDGLPDVKGNSADPEVTVRDAVINMATTANAVIAVGQCASYGGIPAAYSETQRYTSSGTPVHPQWSGASKCNAQGVQGALSGSLNLGFWDSSLSNNKLINVPGCPPHPDWIYGTIVRLVLDIELNILGGVPALKMALDSVGRPAPYYSETIHGPGLCPRYQDYSDGYLARRVGDKGCLAAIGCYGMSTHSDCAKRGWNNSYQNFRDLNGDPGAYKSFCVKAGHPCISCTEPGYPFKVNTNG